MSTEGMISIYIRSICNEKKIFGLLSHGLILAFLLMHCLSVRLLAANTGKKRILGSWKCMEMIPNKPFSKIRFGYTFYTDSVCDYMPGYISKERSLDGKNVQTKYLGTRTGYRLAGNKLGIFNKRENSWQYFHIKDIGATKMTLLSGDSIQYLFSRTEEPKAEKISYDQIILSASGCMGSCPSNIISVKESGEVVYYGIKYNTINGVYSARLDQNIFKEIKSSFSRLPISTLKEEYIIPVKDAEEITVTFIRDGKIVKTIRDNYQQAPHEFYWAYSSLRYLYQNLAADTLSSRLGLIPFTSMLVESTNKRFLLRGAEAFHLWYLLMNRAETRESFEEVYQIQNMGKDEMKKMSSDGRFFRIVDEQGTSKTYDLGFDFFTRNDLLRKFFPK